MLSEEYVRAFVALGSGLDRSKVRPGNKGYPVNAGVFATVCS